MRPPATGRMRVLALDFDGVVSDSAPESFVVALRAFVERFPGSGLEAEARCFAGPGAPPLAQVRSSRLYAGFLELMPLGNRAEDYAVVLGALAQGRSVPDQASYDALRGEQPAGVLEAFHARFYQLRHALAEADPPGWRGLMAPYAPFLEVLRRRASQAELAIATAKDRRSVELLLRLYGIQDLFPAERILDKETGVSKTTHLRALCGGLGVEPAEVTFLDDKLNHLDAVAPLGVRCGLAAWGYNGAREARAARARGHLVCELDDVERQLFPEADSGS